MNHPNPAPMSHLPWQAVFFDFDGVLCASLDVKSRAFATLFAPYGAEVQEAAVRYHQNNGGMPRHEKFRHCFTAIAGQSLDDRQLARAADDFAALVVDEVVDAPLMAGALESLQELKAAAVPAFVVSGTPEEEMRLIVARKGMNGLFAEVCGSPRRKTAILADLLSRHHFAAGQCLFLGDALADYQAATAHGLHFLGIVLENSPSIFPDRTPISSRVTLRL